MQPPKGVIIHRLRAAALDFFSGHLPSGRWFMPQDWITKTPAISERKVSFSKGKVALGTLRPLVGQGLCFCFILVEFRCKIYIFKKVLCETTLGSGKIYPLLIWTWGREWNLDCSCHLVAVRMANTP